MRRRQRRVLVTAVVAGLAGGLCAGARAQEVAPEEPRYRSSKPYASDVDAEERAARRARGESESPLHFVGGLDVRSQYFYRGYNVTSSGAIVQPHGTLLLTVYESEDHSVAITPHIGGWWNFTEETGPKDPVHVSESDAIGGVGVKVGDVLFDLQYRFYNSPNETFSKVQEVGLEVRYDDSRFWRDVPWLTALNPSFALYNEVQDTRDHDRNTYVGLGLEPQMRPVHVGRLGDVTISFPITLGGSYDGYYTHPNGETTHLGFYEVGIKAGLDLPGSFFGSPWRMEAELDYIKLIADSAEKANGNDGDDILFRLGFTFAL